MNVIFWGCLFLIAVYDARENRIPNYLLLLILFLLTLKIINQGESLEYVAYLIASGVILFTVGLAFYFLGAMAPGDVKLLGIIGIIVGWDSLLLASYWILISGGLVGSFYLFNRLSNEPSGSKMLFNKSSLFMLYGHSTSKIISVSSHSEKLRMPFAPVAVIGLALHSYF